jgi:hypothetical protein
MPLELVYCGYPQSTYWTDSFKVFLDQRSHIHAMALFQASILHSSTGTSHSSALSTNSRILFKISQDWLIFSVWLFTSEVGQHNSLASPWHQCTWLIFYELLSQFYSGICLKCPPWESPLEHYLDGGMSPNSITHTWLVSSLLCSNVSFWFGTSVFVDSFCLVLHTRLCHYHELHFCVERHRPNPASPWIISA